MYYLDILNHDLTKMSSQKSLPWRGTPGWPLLPFGQFTFRWPGVAGSEGWVLKVWRVPEIMDIILKSNGTPLSQLR